MTRRSSDRAAPGANNALSESLRAGGLLIIEFTYQRMPYQGNIYQVIRRTFLTSENGAAYHLFALTVFASTSEPPARD
jgi:hypothetical protein